MSQLPSSTLNFETPYFSLHGKHAVYSSLRTFGSKCFPYTWDTRRHKFDPKTLLCIFVGYSEEHKAYKCFHPSSIKKFISRHVVFDEKIFPYKPTNNSCMTTAKSLALNIFNTWLPHTDIPLFAGIHSTSSTAPCLSPLPQIQVIATIPQNSTSLEPQPLLNIVPQTTTRNSENDLPEIDNSINTSENPSLHDTYTLETL